MQPGNVITFCVGLLFIAGAFYVYTSLGAEIARAQETEATVVDIVYETGTKKGRIHPVVRFRAGDGRERVLTSQRHHNVQPGQSVRVLYDPAKPEEIELGTIEGVKHRRILFTALAAIVGLLVCTLGVGLDPNTLKWRLNKR